ncbi:putative GRG-1 glucose-repressible gene-1 protein [Podospora didyma]|uniref:GRG-1 glucose-repressible gene-1 protein n=1 Tax=Podospora didyma TaxID=330526 RepID=A0AAE0KKP2_9PEZI|nr:putative GRG-1 glucose-repressible gene-1 protein [Podospora didyma]
MESVKNAANYVSDKVQGATATASKETNKEVAKDSNAGVGTRIQAAGDALSDKGTESKHDAKAEANKQKLTH